MAFVRINPKPADRRKTRNFVLGLVIKRTICPICRNFESVLPVNQKIVLKIQVKQHDTAREELRN